MPRVIGEGDGVDDAADHGEPGAVDQIPRQLFGAGATAQKLEKPVAVRDANGPRRGSNIGLNPNEIEIFDLSVSQDTGKSTCMLVPMQS